LVAGHQICGVAAMPGTLVGSIQRADIVVAALKA